MEERTALKQGLQSNPKYIPAWYRYDKTGSVLNDECIENSPYYYFHKAEKDLLEDVSKISSLHIVGYCHGHNSTMFTDRLRKWGFGKTRVILDSILEKQYTLHYVPVDISTDFLRDTCSTLSREYNDRLLIEPCPEDYSVGIKMMRKIDNAVFLILFGSLQNCPYVDQIKLLTTISTNMKETDYFLLSVDITQNGDQILEAYLDSTGFCKEFNLNSIVRLNKEMKGNIDLNNFSIERDFYASTNEEETSRVQVFLKAKERQIYRIDALDVDVTFEKGERLNLYEGEGVSHKYTIEQLKYLTKKASLNIHQMWTNEHVALLLLRKADTTM